MVYPFGRKSPPWGKQFLSIGCGYTLSLVKRFFATRKAIKAEYAYQKSIFNHVDDGIRQKIYENMKAMAKKNTKKKIKSERNKSKKRKTKRKKSKEG